jgi:hypothetical protein
MWFVITHSGCVKKGVSSYGCTEWTKKLMETPRFTVVDIVEKRFLSPGNPWPQNPRLKKVGQFMMANFYEGARGVGWKVMKHYGYSVDEIEKIVSDIKNEVTSSKYRFYGPM